MLRMARHHYTPHMTTTELVDTDRETTQLRTRSRLRCGAGTGCRWVGVAAAV